MTRIGLKEALLRTLSDRKIIAVDLSTQSGVNEQSISRYRRNRVDIKASILQSLIDALDTPDYLYFLSLLSTTQTDLTADADPVLPTTPPAKQKLFAALATYISKCQPREFAEVLSLISDATHQNPSFK